MALQDHFHPPLKVWRHWPSFHNGWASNIAAALNQRLPVMPLWLRGNLCLPVDLKATYERACLGLKIGSA